MKKEKYSIIRDEEDLVIFDESDDFVPGELEVLNEEDELDVDYLLRKTAHQEEQAIREKRIQRWVSVGVITAVVAFIAGACYINFRNIL